MHYSNGLYGFSVQKDIYVECGGKLDFSYPSDKTWNKFCNRTAWKSEGQNGMWWVDYPDQFKDNFMSVKGHLPFGLVMGGFWWRLVFVNGVWGDYGVRFFSRIETCEV
ncbi:MAG: GUN4 domain-containing protein [Pseudanabaena sp.]